MFRASEISLDFYGLVSLFVRAPKRELYDQVADAGASQNVAGTRARVADAMDREMEQFIVHAAGAGGSADIPSRTSLATCPCPDKIAT